MVNPTTSPLIFSKLLYNIYLPLPIFLPPTNKNHLVIFLNPSPPELPFLRSLPYISLRKHRGSAHRARGLKARHKPTDEILFPAPPSLRDTSPIWLTPCPVRLRGTAIEKVNSELPSPKADKLNLTGNVSPHS